MSGEEKLPSLPSYNNNINPITHPDPSKPRNPDPYSSGSKPKPANIYRECLKNHAATIGGHVTDGCGEFMPGGADGSLDALKCAACSCHRNFHRRDTTATHHHHRGGAATHWPRPVLSESSSEELNFNSAAAVGVAAPPCFGSKKRFRTKFTAEQKERMLEFAEKLGWRIPREDDTEVQRFCSENGVKRQVFKVWMHNNKSTSSSSKRSASVDLLPPPTTAQQF